MQRRSSPSWSALRLEALTTLLLAHDLEGLRTAAERSLPALDDLDGHARRQHLSLLAFADAATDRMPEARAILPELAAAAPTGWHGARAAVGWHLASALAAADAGDREAARAALTPMLDRFDELEEWPAVLWSYGAALRGGDAAAHQAEFERLRASRCSAPRAKGWDVRLRLMADELSAAASPLAVPLTAREHVVLRALATGSALPALAAEQHVSLNTIKSQLRGVYRKLGVSGRAEALARAALLGLL